MVQREDLVLSKVKKLLDEAKGVYYIRACPQNGTGTPDIIACIDGKFFGIECKDDEKGKYQLTKAQKLRFKQIENAGGTAITIDQYNIEYFEYWLKHVRKVKA